LLKPPALPLVCGHGHGHEEEEHDEDHEEDEDHEDEEHEEEHGEEEEEAGVFIELDQIRYDVNAGWEFDGDFVEKIQIFGGYADYTHTEFEGPGEVGTVYDNEGYEVRAELIQAARGSWRAAHGVQLRERDFSAIGEEAFVSPSLTQQIAGEL